MIRLATIAATVLLSGCAISPIAGDVSRDTVAAYRAANKDLSDASEAWLCRGMSVREWMQRFGVDRARADAWRTICATPPAALPVDPYPDYPEQL